MVCKVAQTPSQKRSKKKLHHKNNNKIIRSVTLDCSGRTDGNGKISFMRISPGQIQGWDGHW